MLDLMNNARLGVAAQAIGVAEAAFREAREYAAQRVQFGTADHRAAAGQVDADADGDPRPGGPRAALPHLRAPRPDARAGRVPGVRSQPQPTRSAQALQAEHQRSVQLVRFFTPLCKYYATEISNEVTRRGIQVHGGIGYMAESRAGHYHSDSIITTIYEGTSEIQASFALKEMSKGAIFAALEEVGAELESVRAQHPELVEQVHGGIEWISKSVTALMARPALRAAERQAAVRDGHRRAGGRGAAAAGRALGGEARPGDDLHPSPHARRGDERPPHQQRGRVAAASATTASWGCHTSAWDSACLRWSRTFSTRPRRMACPSPSGPLCQLGSVHGDHRTLLGGGMGRRRPGASGRGLPARVRDLGRRAPAAALGWPQRSSARVCTGGERWRPQPKHPP